MQKTTEQKTSAAPKATDLAARIQNEKERSLAEWERSEELGRATRAELLASRLVTAQLQQERLADIPYCEKRFASYGCRPVLAAWPTIPVPRATSAPYAPNDRQSALESPRPVVYNAAVYRLDERGVHMRRADYWIATPVFQTARGVDETRPDVYAVQVDGKWRTVPADPNQPGALRATLTGAGLRLNPEPVHLDGNLDATTPERFGLHSRHMAWDRLAIFFADHRRELPIHS